MRGRPPTAPDEYLALLRERPGLRSSEVASYFGVSRQRAALVLVQLEGQGLAYRYGVPGGPAVFWRAGRPSTYSPPFSAEEP